MRLILLVLVGCTGDKSVDPDVDPPTRQETGTYLGDTDASPTYSVGCALELASGGLDEDCNGTAAQTVPLSAARRLEIIGEEWSLLGGSVACTSVRVGAFERAIAVGASEQDGLHGQAGWAAVVDGSRTGTLGLLEADLTIRGGKGDAGGPIDTLGSTVRFPGDVDGADGELLVMAMNAYRPGAQSGAGFLYEAGSPGALSVEDYDAWFQGGEAGAMLGGATVAGDLDGDGKADLVLGFTYAHFPEPGYIGIFRGADFQGAVAPTAAATRIDAVDGVERTGLSMGVADITGDGEADLVVGEPDFEGTLNPGQLTVLRGPLLGPGSRSLSEAQTIAPLAEFAKLSTFLAIGNLNADGDQDLVVSAHGATGDMGERAGAAYVFFGPLDGTETTVESADIVIEAETAFSFLALA